MTQNLAQSGNKRRRDQQTTLTATSKPRTSIQQTGFVARNHQDTHCNKMINRHGACPARHPHPKKTQNEVERLTLWRPSGYIHHSRAASRNTPSRPVTGAAEDVQTAVLALLTRYHESITEHTLRVTRQKASYVRRGAKKVSAAYNDVPEASDDCIRKKKPSLQIWPVEADSTES